MDKETQIPAPVANELPPDMIIPARIVVTRASGEKLLGLLESPPEPTPALRKLMRHGG